MWATHYNVTILITFKPPNVGTISCYVSLFLAQKTVILIEEVDFLWNRAVDSLKTSFHLLL